MADSDDLDRDAIYQDSGEAVDMAPADIEEWLASEESKTVGWPEDGGDESIGHHPGCRIVAIRT